MSFPSFCLSISRSLGWVDLTSLYRLVSIFIFSPNILQTMNIIKIFLIFPLEDTLSLYIQFLMLVLMFVEELDYLIIYHRWRWLKIEPKQYDYNFY